ncbi:GMP synthase [Aestuariibius sp. HNIBRBA575]|uniref:GMP synthase n=1 Tax=Aestuariibius sp. HNIBRBA575 TaxID=3233343 RepID=UPI0034A15EE2
MPQFTHSIARIAVWNLAGFQFRNFNDPNWVPKPMSEERTARQAEGLALLDAELVTLVEVNPLDHIQRLADVLLAEYGVQYHVSILKQPDADLNIGFLHKPGVDVSDIAFIPGSNGAYQNGRQAIKAQVRIGKFKAIIVGVHLKSGRDKGDQNIRDSQCKVIGDYLTHVRETPGLGHHTLMLMGDFNMIPGQDVSNFHHLGGEDVMDFVSCWDLQDRYSHILDAGRANLLDGFAVSRTWSGDYIRGSLRLFPMHWTMTRNGEPGMGREKFKEEVSDHLPFVASVRIF